MNVGIFSKIYANYSVEEAFRRIRNAGIANVQFNFVNVGLKSLPDAVSEKTIEEIKRAAAENNITIPIVSGTFNTLELDDEKRQKNMHNFGVVTAAAAKLNIPYVSISTGSFNQEDFWSPHPDNHTEKAWTYLYHTLDQMLKIATDHGVTIVVEPEQSNVISTTADTLKLMHHYESPNLKVLFDAANIVTTEDADHLETKIKDSLKKLEPYIAIAHCKDCLVTAKQINFAPISKGNLPLKSYLKELRKYYRGPIIMHGLEEADVESALVYIEAK